MLSSCVWLPPPWLHTREPLDSPVLLHLLLRRLLVLARSFICVTCSHNISGCLTQPQIHWLKCYMLLSLFHTPFLFPCLSLSVSRSLAVCKHPVLPVLFHSRLFLSSSPHMNVPCSAAVIITVVFFPELCSSQPVVSQLRWCPACLCRWFKSPFSGITELVNNVLQPQTKSQNEPQKETAAEEPET